MIEHVIEWSIRNRFLVFLLAAALTVAGVFAVSRTPMDANLQRECRSTRCGKSRLRRKIFDGHPARRR